MKDDLVYRGNFKVGFGKTIISSIAVIKERMPKEWSLPLLILHGEDDTITKISDTIELHKSLSGHDEVEFIRYPKLRHELFNEVKSEVST